MNENEKKNARDVVSFFLLKFYFSFGFNENNIFYVNYAFKL